MSNHSVLLININAIVQPLLLVMIRMLGWINKLLLMILIVPFIFLGAQIRVKHMISQGALEQSPFASGSRCFSLTNSDKVLETNIENLLRMVNLQRPNVYFSSSYYDLDRKPVPSEVIMLRINSWDIVKMMLIACASSNLFTLEKSLILQIAIELVTIAARIHIAQKKMSLRQQNNWLGYFVLLHCTIFLVDLVISAGVLISCKRIEVTHLLLRHPQVELVRSAGQQYSSSHILEVYKGSMNQYVCYPIFAVFARSMKFDYFLLQHR